VTPVPGSPRSVPPRRGRSWRAPGPASTRPSQSAACRCPPWPAPVPGGAGSARPGLSTCGQKVPVPVPGAKAAQPLPQGTGTGTLCPSRHCQLSYLCASSVHSSPGSCSWARRRARPAAGSPVAVFSTWVVSEPLALSAMSPAWGRGVRGAGMRSQQRRPPSPFCRAMAGRATAEPRRGCLRAPTPVAVQPGLSQHIPLSPAPCCAPGPGHGLPRPSHAGGAQLRQPRGRGAGALPAAELCVPRAPLPPAACGTCRVPARSEGCVPAAERSSLLTCLAQWVAAWRQWLAWTQGGSSPVPAAPALSQSLPAA